MTLFALSIICFLVLAYASAQSPGGGGYLPQNIGSSGDCFGSFPHLRRRFSWEQLEFFCQQRRLHESAVLNETSVQPFTENQLKWLSTLALKPNLTEPESFMPRVRKEYRLLTTSQRYVFMASIQQLKFEKVDNISKFDILVMLHHPAMAPGSHIGAAFLPWHREYLRLFEVALGQTNPSASIPIWDSTKDSALPDPSDSVFWSSELVGNGVGPVTTGPFAGWTYKPNGDEEEGFPLWRNLSAAGTLIGPELEEFVHSREGFRDLTACVDLTFEEANRKLHEYVGGAMASVYYSPQDPLFLMHHAYLDSLWEQYRHQQSKVERALDYPSNYEACTQFHFASSPMSPFEPLVNIDGMRDVYRLYTIYDPPVQCSTVELDCKSKFLFCQSNSGRCLSKIVDGGNCEGFSPNDEPCYKSRCFGGICSSTLPTPPPFDPEGSGERFLAPTAKSKPKFKNPLINPETGRITQSQDEDATPDRLPVINDDTVIT